jgi:hypothetical protein
VQPALELLESRLAPSVDLLNWRGAVPGDNTGVNYNETQLTPANVNTGGFGLQFSYPVDGQIYAQPLVKTGVTIGNGSTHDIVYVVTQHDSVYAFDAYGGGLLWHDSFIDPANGITSVPNGDTGSGDIAPEIGITSTPTIDPNLGVLYTVTKTKNIEGGVAHYVQQLHALDLGTGTEELGGPVTIGDTARDGGPDGGYTDITEIAVQGGPNGDGHDSNNIIRFNALRQNDRDGLFELNGVLYLTYSSHGDQRPYHGWIIGYDPQTLQLVSVFNTDPNGNEAAIWMGGGQPAFDANGFLYAATGNGTYDAGTTGGPDYGETVMRIDPNTPGPNGTMSVADYFTPADWSTLNGGDTDLGSGGVLLLPDEAGSPDHPHLLVQGGKEGEIFLLDRDNMGGLTSNDSGPVQILPNGTVSGGSYDTPAYFNGRIYYMGPNDVVKAFAVSNAHIDPTPVARTNLVFGQYGATPFITTDGSGDGIVWVMDDSRNGTNGRPNGPAVLHAYDANTLQELYNTSQVPTDQLGNADKFTVPTVINGMVYVPTQTGLYVYGLNQVATTPAAPSNLAVQSVFADSDSTLSANLTWVSHSTNEDGFSLEWSTDGVNFAQLATLPAGTTSYTDGGLADGTYYYRVLAFNGSGNSNYSNVDSVLLGEPGQDVLVDHSGGFDNPSDFTSNGTNGFVSNGGTVVARLVDGGGNENGGFFTTSRLGVDNFTTTFTFQFSGGASADGMCFVIQGASPTALITGQGGGGLGYGSDHVGGPQGIPNSIAIKFDLYQNATEGPDSTGLFVNGDSPTVPSSPDDVLVDLRGTGIDLHSGHVFQVTLSYDGSTLTEDIVDTATGGEFIVSYGVDIVGQLGGNVGYAGFTAGTGGLTTIADIQSWTYQFTEPSFGPAPHRGGNGGGLGGSGWFGLSGPTPALWPAVGQARIAGAPAIPASTGSDSRGIADILSANIQGQPASWQPLNQGNVSGQPVDSLGQPLDTGALDHVFSRM